MQFLKLTQETKPKIDPEKNSSDVESEDSGEDRSADEMFGSPNKAREQQVAGNQGAKTKDEKDNEKTKKKKKKSNARNIRFAETIGVEDNDKYPRFKESQRLLVNLSNCKYFVVRFVLKQIFNFKLSYKQQSVEEMESGYEMTAGNEDWDIFWTDTGVLPERIAKMKPYQKVNHFPGMFQLARKNHLARNLVKMQKEFDKEYKFFPKTFNCPSEYGEFKNSLANKTASARPYYIVKPEAGCQGRGIFLTNNHEDLNPDAHYVVQKYIKNPLLIEGLKFDIRLYVLVLSVDPLRIYLFEEGLARFSTDAYRAPSKKNANNMFMHLTNYAINCRNKGKFIFNKALEDCDSGHKRSYSSVLEWIEENYDNGPKRKQEMMHKTEQLIIKTMCTVVPSLRHYLNIPSKAQYDLDMNLVNNPGQVNSMCFEILGFDVLIDDKLKPWLIEINHAPSFSTDTPFDFKIKKDVIADTVQLLGMTHKRKKKIVKSHKSNINKRMLMTKRSVKVPGKKQPSINVTSPLTK